MPATLEAREKTHRACLESLDIIRRSRLSLDELLDDLESSDLDGLVEQITWEAHHLLTVGVGIMDPPPPPLPE